MTSRYSPGIRKSSGQKSEQGAEMKVKGEYMVKEMK